MNKITELRMQLMEKMEYVRQHPDDPVNILRKMEIEVLKNQIKTLEEG